MTRNQIIHGDCLEILPSLPEQSVDLIFADPPYKLQLQNELLRPDQSVVDGVDDAWDQFADLAAYDAFTRAWLVVLAASNPGDLVLDPFVGSGTTAAVAKKLQRNYLGIEHSPEYVALARVRLAAIPESQLSTNELVTPSKRTAPRISFAQLIEAQYLTVGQALYARDRQAVATIKADAQLLWQGQSGSIHKLAALIQQQSAWNGWEFWYYEDANGTLVSIDVLREHYRRVYYSNDQ